MKWFKTKGGYMKESIELYSSGNKTTIVVYGMTKRTKEKLQQLLLADIKVIDDVIPDNPVLDEKSSTEGMEKVQPDSATTTAQTNSLPYIVKIRNAFGTNLKDIRYIPYLVKEYSSVNLDDIQALNNELLNTLNWVIPLSDGKMRVLLSMVCTVPSADDVMAQVRQTKGSADNITAIKSCDESESSEILQKILERLKSNMV